MGCMAQLAKKGAKMKPKPLALTFVYIYKFPFDAEINNTIL